MSYKLLALQEDLFFAKLKMNLDRFVYLSFGKKAAWIGFPYGKSYYFSFNVVPDEPSEVVLWEWKGFTLTRLATDAEQDEWYENYAPEPEPDYDPVTLAEMHETSRYQQQNLNDPMRYPL
jgi:hypothetical protein